VKTHRSYVDYVNLHVTTKGDLDNPGSIELIEIPNDTDVEILGENYKFFLVKVNEHIGYINKKFLI
jgi:hypothetical protein